jgi:hypothetical protein
MYPDGEQILVIFELDGDTDLSQVDHFAKVKIIKCGKIMKRFTTVPEEKFDVIALIGGVGVVHEENQKKMKTLPIYKPTWTIRRMTLTLTRLARITGNYEKKSICLLRLSKICLTSTGNRLRISLLTQMAKVARGGIFGSLDSAPRKS